MGKRAVLLITIFGLFLLTACGESKEKDTTLDTEDQDELKTLNVAFEIPETADVDEEVELTATVTYGEDKVTDADDVEFEYWLAGHKDDSTMLDAKNNNDGTYTQTVSFDKDGKYEIFAHVTAKTLHTMPKKSITIGNGANSDENTDDKNK
jgi:hypothetical protein